MLGRLRGDRIRLQIHRCGRRRRGRRARNRARRRSRGCRFRLWLPDYLGCAGSCSRVELLERMPEWVEVCGISDWLQNLRVWVGGLRLSVGGGRVSCTKERSSMSPVRHRPNKPELACETKLWRYFDLDGSLNLLGTNTLKFNQLA